jgi:hypothetical protein
LEELAAIHFAFVGREGAAVNGNGLTAAPGSPSHGRE